MLRWSLTALFAVSALDTALGADKVVKPRAKPHARVILPPGLPRPHYDYRTTVVYDRTSGWRKRLQKASWRSSPATFCGASGTSR